VCQGRPWNTTGALPFSSGLTPLDQGVHFYEVGAEVAQGHLPHLLLQETMSPFTAVALLCLFKQGRMSLTTAQFDECFDALMELMEDSNDEKHRLRTDPPPQETP